MSVSRGGLKYNDKVTYFITVISFHFIRMMIIFNCFILMVFLTRVRGLKGIRVVDASIMPVIASCNPYATVAMIAEKAADLIKYDYRS